MIGIGSRFLFLWLLLSLYMPRTSTCSSVATGPPKLHSRSDQAVVSTGAATTPCCSTDVQRGNTNRTPYLSPDPSAPSTRTPSTRTSPDPSPRTTEPSSPEEPWSPASPASPDSIDVARWSSSCRRPPPPWPTATYNQSDDVARRPQHDRIQRHHEDRRRRSGVIQQTLGGPTSCCAGELDSSAAGRDPSSPPNGTPAPRVDPQKEELHEDVEPEDDFSLHFFAEVWPRQGREVLDMDDHPGALGTKGVVVRTSSEEDQDTAAAHNVGGDEVDDDEALRVLQKHLLEQSHLLDPARQQQRCQKLLRVLKMASQDGKGAEDSVSHPHMRNTHGKILFRILDVRLNVHQDRDRDEGLVFVFELRLEPTSSVGRVGWRHKKTVSGKLVWVEHRTQIVRTELAGQEYGVYTPAFEFDLFFCPLTKAATVGRLRWVSAGSALGVPPALSTTKNLGKLLILAGSLILDFFGVAETSLQDAAKVPFLTSDESTAVMAAMHGGDSDSESSPCNKDEKRLGGRGDDVDDTHSHTLFLNGLENYLAGTAGLPRRNSSPQSSCENTPQHQQHKLSLSSAALLSGLFPFYTRHFGYVAKDRDDLDIWMRESRRIRALKFPKEFQELVFCVTEFSAIELSSHFQRDGDEAVMSLLKRRGVFGAETPGGTTRSSWGSERSEGFLELGAFVGLGTFLDSGGTRRRGLGTVDRREQPAEIAEIPKRDILLRLGSLSRRFEKAVGLYLCDSSMNSHPPTSPLTTAQFWTFLHEQKELALRQIQRTATAGRHQNRPLQIKCIRQTTHAVRRLLDTLDLQRAILAYVGPVVRVPLGGITGPRVMGDYKTRIFS